MSTLTQFLGGVPTKRAPWSFESGTLYKNLNTDGPYAGYSAAVTPIDLVSVSGSGVFRGAFMGWSSGNGGGSTGTGTLVIDGVSYPVTRTNTNKGLYWEMGRAPNDTTAGSMHFPLGDIVFSESLVLNWNGDNTAGINWTLYYELDVEL